MIEEFSITNFKSFRDEATISFEASKDDCFNSSVSMPDGKSLLRFAVILGANASGKSNFLDAFEFLRRFWNNIPAGNDVGVDLLPFLLQKDALSKDSRFSIKLYINGLRYWYQLVVNPEHVVKEELFVYLSSRPTKVFGRKETNGVAEISFNQAIAKTSAAENDVLTMNCLRNMSVVATLKKINILIPYLSDMRRWIDGCMMPLAKGSETEISKGARDLLDTDSVFREYLLRFAHEADFNISDIKIRKMSALFGHSVMTETGPENYLLPESCQSSGTTRMVQLEALIYRLLKCQGFLPIDEIEASMHPRLMEFVLSNFVNHPDNRSQLLVTTHYDPILKDIDDIFGKDSVWFTEKLPDGASTIYPLSDFRGLNKLSSFHRAYINGQFGALPNIL